ncbi:hypothetical protein BZG36_01540 [Bifiguratus adelaidae]|uniref:CCHC-type domain-containing protein n=1 Tax=Bifiguratus adelaidae TaxID=1938954 RepID=A0A261Y400_9FUNG|nr:hypothetical protein BZG36_01540 [Bifiguratus adelaidae]
MFKPYESGIEVELEPNLRPNGVYTCAFCFKTGHKAQECPTSPKSENSRFFGDSITVYYWDPDRPKTYTTSPKLPNHRFVCAPYRPRKRPGRKPKQTLKNTCTCAFCCTVDHLTQDCPTSQSPNSRVLVHPYEHRKKPGPKANPKSAISGSSIKSDETHRMPGRKIISKPKNTYTCAFCFAVGHKAQDCPTSPKSEKNRFFSNSTIVSQVTAE